jgi:hypothetical protein
MKKIVIVSDKKEEKRGLVSLLRLLFAECEIRIVPRHDGTLSPLRQDDDHGDVCVSRFDYE